MLFVPQQNPAYYVSIAVPLVLAVARGADRVADRLRATTARALGAATIVAAVVLIVAAGKLSVTNSRALNAAVPYLEARCATGCLTNVLASVAARPGLGGHRRGRAASAARAPHRARGLRRADRP